MDSVENLASKLFRRLFSTPTIGLSLFLILIVYILIIPLLQMIILNITYYEPIMYSMILLMLILISTCIVFYKTPILKVNTVRRILAYPLYIGLLMIPALIISSYVMSLRNVIVPLYVYSVITVFSYHVVQRATTTRGFISTLALSLTPSFLLIPILYVFHNPIDIVVVLALGLLASASSELYLQLVLSRCKGVSRDDVLNMFRGFAKDWLESNPSLLESSLLKFAENIDGWVKILRFKVGNDILLILQTSFHNGPIRDVGGSKMVSELTSKLKSFRFKGMIVHPPSNHMLDPVSARDREVIINKMLSCIKLKGTPIKLSGKPFVKTHGRWMIHVYPFNPTPLLLITSRWGGIDDLPPELNEYCDEIARRYGFKGCIIVESHNSIAKDYKLTISDIKELKVLIEDSISSIDTTLNLEFKLWMEHVDKEYVGSECLDVCSGGITVLVLNVDDELYSIIDVDGNNMEDKFRSKIERLGRDRGFKIVSVLTTDSHELTGKFTGTPGYNVVGSICPDRIVKVIDEMLMRCREKLSKPYADVVTCEVKDVNVLGSKGLKVIGYILEGPGRIASKTLVLTNLLCYIILGFMITLTFR